MPAATFRLELTVSAELPEFTSDGGVNLALANFGDPLTDSVTVPVNPAPAAMDTVRRRVAYRGAPAGDSSVADVLLQITQQRRLWVDG